MITITPTLYMGPPEAAGARSGLIPVDNAPDAYTAILSGHSALLAPGSWELAAEVLRMLDVGDEDWIAFKLDEAGRGCAA